MSASDKSPGVFPVASTHDGDHGITLRDFFAAAAISSGHEELSQHELGKVSTHIKAALVANRAYEIADAMLKARRGGA